MSVGTPTEVLTGPLANAEPIASSKETAELNVRLQSGVALEALSWETVDQSEVQLHAQIWVGAKNLARQLDEVNGSISADRALSPEGRSAARRSAGIGTLRDVSKLEASARAAGKLADANEAALVEIGRIRFDTAPPAPGESAAMPRSLAEKRVHAVMDQLAAVDSLQLSAMYAHAEAAEDWETVAAIENLGPRLDPRAGVMRPALYDEINDKDGQTRVRASRLARGRRRNEAAARKLDQDRRLAAAYESAARAVRSEVLSRVPALDDRKIEVLR